MIYNCDGQLILLEKLSAIDNIASDSISIYFRYVVDGIEFDVSRKKTNDGTRIREAIVEDIRIKLVKAWYNYSMLEKDIPKEFK